MASISTPSNSDNSSAVEYIAARIVGTHRENRTVWFTFEFLFKDLVWTVDIRYSQLYSLYRSLAAENSLPSDTTVVFPPKKLANTNPVFIETRRNMLETWLATVLRMSSSFSNSELLDLVNVPVTAMVWIRKYKRMLADEDNVKKESSQMLWIDTDAPPPTLPSESQKSVRVADDILVAAAVFAGAAFTQPVISIAGTGVAGACVFLKMRISEALMPAAISHGAAGRTLELAEATYRMQEFCFGSVGALVETNLPLFTSGIPKRRKLQRKGVMRRLNLVPPAEYTVKVSRPRERDGSMRPFDVKLAKDSSDGFCWITYLEHNNALSKAGLLPGDNLIALDRTTLFQATQEKVLNLLQNAPENFNLSFTRALEVHTINIGKHIRTSNEPLPMGATLVSDEDLMDGSITHKFRYVQSEGAGSRAGILQHDILLEVDGISTKSFSHRELKEYLQKITPDVFLVARPRPPVPSQDASSDHIMVKLESSDVASGGFICPICLKDMSSMESLQDHFVQTHSEVDHTLPPLPNVGAETSTSKQHLASTTRRGKVGWGRGGEKQPASPRVRSGSTVKSSGGKQPSPEQKILSDDHDMAVHPKPPPVNQVRFCRFCGKPFVGWSTEAKQEHLATCDRAPIQRVAIGTTSAHQHVSQQPSNLKTGIQHLTPSSKLHHFEQDFDFNTTVKSGKASPSLQAKSSQRSPKLKLNVDRPKQISSPAVQNVELDKWWVEKKAPNAVVKDVAAAQCGDFLVRKQGQNIDKVVVVMNDFGTVRSLLVLVHKEGKAQLAGRDTAVHASLYHLIHHLRSTPQRSTAHVGKVFTLRNPASKSATLYPTLVGF